MNTTTFLLSVIASLLSFVLAGCNYTATTQTSLLITALLFAFIALIIRPKTHSSFTFSEKIKYSYNLILSNCKNSRLRLNKNFWFSPFSNVKYFWN